MGNAFECCHHCDSRHQGCHSECEHYKNALQVNEDLKRKKWNDDDVRAYMIHSCYRMKRHNPNPLKRRG